MHRKLVYATTILTTVLLAAHAHDQQYDDVGHNDNGWMTKRLAQFED